MNVNESVLIDLELAYSKGSHFFKVNHVYF